MYTMLRDSNPTAAKISLDVMVELYKRNIWWASGFTLTRVRVIKPFIFLCLIWCLVCFHIPGMMQKLLMSSQQPASPKWQRYYFLSFPYYPSANYTYHCIDTLFIVFFFRSLLQDFNSSLAKTMMKRKTVIQNQK